MSIKTTIPKEVKSAPASSGARQPKGKTSECDSVILDAKVLKAKPETVRPAVEIPGAARAAIDTQVFTKGDEGGGGSDHHKRATNSWGVTEPKK